MFFPSEYLAVEIIENASTNIKRASVEQTSGML